MIESLSGHAAGLGLRALGATGLLSGSLVGGSLGLAGVVMGYRQAKKGVDFDRQRALKRMAIAQGVAVIVACVLMLLLPPIAGTMIAIPMLVAVLSGTVLATGAPRLGGLAGLSIGTLGGVSGAAMGLHWGGAMDGWLAAALLLQLICFVSVPLALGFAVSRQFGVQLRWWFVGALGWVFAAPFLALGGPIASAVVGPSPLAGAIGLSVAAGLAEESSRYGLYRLIHRFWGPLEGHRAVVLGLGHGGVEALLFGLGAMAWILSGGQQMDPGSHALFGLSRLLLLLGHVGFTMLIWRAVSRRDLRFWMLSVLAHIGLDLAAFAGPIVLPNAGLPLAGATILAWAVLSAWMIRAAIRQ